MRIGRRALLGALGASALFVRRAWAADPAAALRQMLDGLGAVPLAERPRALAGFDPTRLDPSARLDLETVRRGVAIDAELARLFPGGKAEALPYKPAIGAGGVGAEGYRPLLERALGGAIDPEALHRRFEREAAHLAGRADPLLRGIGYSKGSLGERFRAFFRDPRWHYPDSDSGRDQAVAAMNRWLDTARAQVSALIGTVPPLCLDVSARRMARAEEAAGKAGYRVLPSPGQSGAYFVDLHDMARRPSWSLKSVVHHELLPGHMIQLPMEAAARPHPLRLAYLAGFAEGWAIHAEAEMARRGAYRGDAAGELGHIHWLLFRVCRGLADTGMHLHGWSLAEARARVAELQGEPAYFAPFDTDLPRIQADPAIRAAEAATWLVLRDVVARTRSDAGRHALYRRILTPGRGGIDTLGR